MKKLVPELTLDILYIYEIWEIFIKMKSDFETPYIEWRFLCPIIEYWS